jgi:hypothetical protein
MQDDERQYHSLNGYVQVGNWLLEWRALWDGVEAAETANFTLDQIGQALLHNKPAAQLALARKDLAALRMLIEGAAP